MKNRKNVSEADATDKEVSKSKGAKPAATSKKQSLAPFPIVGIGASAGGLDAFTEFLKHLPLDTGMGFVLVQHLDPQHASALPQLLARATSMRVSEVTNNLRVEPNHIYVIPPNANLSIVRGALKLQPRQARRVPHHSVDFFFESLARDRRERAIGVILSGTATDGMVGMEAIKAEGGITFAQDDSARYDSMPRSAIAAGCVDFVLSPENIADELARIAKHPYVAGHPPERVAPSEAEKESAAKNGFKKILLLLRNHSGMDFSLYKSTTIRRRIARRMLLNKVNRPDAYANFLRGKPKELSALYTDMLISVTAFFRNPAAFDVLKEKVFPKLVGPQRDQPLRVWVPGCSSGQEAYSIAMAFVEFAEQSGQGRRLQLFATDANEELLEKGRAGFYAESLVHDLSPGRLRRFFVKEDGGYRAAKFLREMVVFARQNLLSDPPFSRMDLISCRNMLIYLEADAQRKVLPTLHYALRPEGFLFLGESESPGPVADLFATVDRKYKIYCKKPGLAAHPHFAPRHPGERKEISAPGRPGAPEGFHAEVNAQREADRVALNRYAPPGVLLNAQGRVLQFRGETSPFLKPPTGNASFHVLKMTREGLMLPLRTALKKAKEENKPVRREGVRVAQNGATRRVNFDVVPLTHLKERCYLVFFEDAEKAGRAILGSPSREQPSGAVRTARPANKKEESRRVAELECELSETRDYLQSVQEQNEAANEELQSSNEEVTSANEELQSINEELETSKEELESSNEELTTVNEEMANRNAELNRANADLNNLHASVNLPIVVLTRDLAIRRFTPPAAELFNFVDTDVGRPMSNVRHNLDLPDLEALLKQVIDTISERGREVRDKAGRCYSLRAHPYLTLDHKIDGAVLVLVNIDELKRGEQAIAAARDFAANTVETVRESLLVLDAQLRIESANRAFYRTFGVSPQLTVGKFIYDVGNRQWNIPGLRALLEEILPRQKTIENFEVEHDFEHIGHRTMLLNARRIEDTTWKTHRILLAIEDITERKQLQQQVQGARLAEVIMATARDPLLILNADLRVHMANEAYYKTFRATAAESEGRLISELGNGQWRIPRLRQLLEDVLPRNSFFNDFEVTHDFERIGRRIMLLNGRKLAGGAPERILLGIQDITEVLQFQAVARENADKFRVLFQGSPGPMWAVDMEALRFIDVNQAAVEHYGYSREEFLGMSLLDICTPEAGQAFQSTLAHPPERFFSQRRKKNGEVVDVEVAGSELRLGGKRVWLSSVSDITERKRADEALHQSETRLRLLVEGSPNAMVMANDAGAITLVNAQTEKIFGYTRDKLLGQPVEILVPERFRIGHPMLRTGFLQAPIARPMGVGRELFAVRKDGTEVAVEIGLSPLKTGDRTFVLATITDISRRKQVEEALRLAQAQLADRAGWLEPVDVAKLLRGMLESNPDFQEPKADVAVEGVLPAVVGNEAALTQCFSNLLNNAVKFVPPETKPRVRVSAERDGNTVRIWVTDNGIGIAPLHLDNIFGMSQRLDTAYPGTGIGLSIVRKTMERMDGRVGVESELGKGSRFWLDLKAASAESEDS